MELLHRAEGRAGLCLCLGRARVMALSRGPRKVCHVPAELVQLLSVSVTRFCEFLLLILPTPSPVGQDYSPSGGR